MKKILNILVVVGALGYFVDIYDLVLFSIVRVASLKSLGLTGEGLFKTGVMLLNMQMFGMLVGGVMWGVLGDRRGRLSVLFGSIVLYSVANFANAFVHTIPAYAVWRFLAGMGLAGELGAGVTLVAETLSKEYRGYGTMLVASVGVAGAVVAGLVSEHFSWRTNYLIGGVLGLALLLLRIGAYESDMFHHAAKQSVRRGNFFSLFTSASKLGRYLKCILIGMPLWYVVGILITFSPEIAKNMGILEPIIAGKSLMFCYLGLVLGDAVSGALSQWLRSRKKVIAAFLLGTAVMIATYLFAPMQTAKGFYSVCFVLGVAIGYWAVFITVAAEQFGTNLRATVATTVPNFVRGAVVPLTFLFASLKGLLGLVNAAAIVGSLCILVAGIALLFLPETYGKDLDFVEI